MKIFDSWKSWAEAKQSLALRLPVDTLNSLEQAFRFATGYHSEQKRPNGDPYIVHLPLPWRGIHIPRAEHKPDSHLADHQ